MRFWTFSVLLTSMAVLTACRRTPAPPVDDYAPPPPLPPGPDVPVSAAGLEARADRLRGGCVRGDLVILQLGDRSVQARDLSTGEARWRHAGLLGACLGAQVLVLGDDAVHTVDPRSGASVASLPLPAPPACTGMAWVQDVWAEDARWSMAITVQSVGWANGYPPSPREEAALEARRCCLSATLTERDGAPSTIVHDARRGPDASRGCSTSTIPGPVDPAPPGWAVGTDRLSAPWEAGVHRLRRETSDGTVVYDVEVERERDPVP
ncbi:MAG: hypothetical protein H6734_07185 [Alphaproteobacteria bacterium]|nr:hypothetical protein [Alphaproteobacteria bacterium]